jgi:DNA mismatch endonuclease (patch repair protein)
MRPKPSSSKVSSRMQRQRSRDTEIEVALRSALHKKGLRFRIHRRPLPSLRREADIVFPSARVAVFVDGCFWHGCLEHASWPAANAEWWRAKIEANRKRDEDTDRKLEAAGWKAVRIWEHVPIEAGVGKVLAAVSDGLLDG